MSQSALVIGVNRTGGLPPLSGAVAGAHDFADWARGQGMSVTLLTDEDGGEVTVSRLQDAVDRIVEPRNCRKLVVYFAGHGFLLGANLELWLLSKAPERGQEAVNVRLSMDNARYSGIEHVIFVSDACRSGGPTHQHRTVSGTAVFPPPSTYEFDAKLDSFYATRPGDAALEYHDEQEAVENYKGLFTECLLSALRGREPDVVVEHTENGDTRWVVLSEHLDTHLETIVPIRAEDISIKLSQKPIVIPESRLPQYFGALEARPDTVRGPGGTAGIPRQPGLTRMVDDVRGDVLAMRSDDPFGAQPASTEEERTFVGQVDRILAARGRHRFETTTGFTVHGDVGRVTLAQGWQADVFREDGATQVRIHPASDDEGVSMLLELDDGTGTVLATIPGYIGIVLVEDGQVVSVVYTPSGGTSLYDHEYVPYAPRIERRRAFAATATRHGLFELDADEAGDAAEYLRMMKRLDPTLGIYAAYAYQQAGRLRSIRSVARYMAQDGVVPFDVALLGRLDEPWPPTAPFCPMLRQGWGLLELHPPTLERLSWLRSELLPSLWTLFTPSGAGAVRERLEQGDLR